MKIIVTDEADKEYIDSKTWYKQQSDGWELKFES